MFRMSRRQHQVQVQHEAKRKERYVEKLQGRLRELLSERSREARVAMEAVGHFKASARGRAKKSDEAMYQVGDTTLRIGQPTQSDGIVQSRP